MASQAVENTGLRVRRWFDQWKKLLDTPVATYHIILWCVVFLVAFGLIMVLSASSVTSYAGGEGSPFSVFFRQLLFAVVGLGVMLVASRMDVAVWKKFAPVAVVLCLVLQILPLTPLGVNVNGNRSWFSVGGGFRIQPAEFAKIALALYIGQFMAARISKLSKLGQVIPVFLISGISIALVIAGHDLGTGLILIAVVLGALFVGGLPWKWLGLIAVTAATTVFLMVVTSANRLARIEALFTGNSAEASDPLGQHWQSNHGLFALASGGWLGVGLGGSREKWAWLPEAHNDFIFAIIGEELGLVGSLAVVLLFAALSYGIVRIIMRSDDRFIQAASAGLLAWLTGQAFVNIAVVTGLVPVIGVPLPFVSYGGSSLVATLLAAGILLSFARAEPGAKEALRWNRFRNVLLARMSKTKE